MLADWLVDLIDRLTGWLLADWLASYVLSAG